ncbi:hypothetical protein [Pinibacter soli]|uniref:Uncharacterized protein n=1 Tax=Pinibacter soli TaxID=3044211 RepID=A0ABT6RFP7_9BACT|nr:hypothetical protein [Pinibacter soli]MDI3321387.1 hypothetical protein [Pinibacter soli]
MKFVGFIKEEDENIRSAKHLEEMLFSENNDQDIRNRIVEYLEKGIFLTGVMSYIYDNENKPIGNLDYFTDGEFIWPIYYPYYLKKYANFSIDEDLLQYAKINSFKFSVISKERLGELEDIFLMEWSGRYR